MRHLGRTLLRELQPAAVERMLGALAAEGKSPYTITNVRSVLRAALSDAERNGLVDRHVARLARAPHLPPSDPAVLTPEALVLASCEPDLRRTVTLSLDTGLRQGELLGPNWPCLDKENGCLPVRATLERADGVYRLGEPKSATSRRTISLSPVSLAVLQEQRAESRPGPNPDPVWTTAMGEPRNGTSVTNAFQDALAAAGLLRLTWKDLRAIHVGLLVHAGVGLTVTRDRLGHRSIAVTSRHYAGAQSALAREAADAVEKRLG